MSPRVLPADLVPTRIPSIVDITTSTTSSVILPEREAMKIGLRDLPQDYQRLIVEGLFVDNLFPNQHPKVRCVFVQYKGQVPLAGIALSTVSGTLWENVLYPNEPNRPQGIAHLVEHLIYSKPSPEADDVRQWFADRNGDSNACTTDSDMRLWLCIPPRFLKEALSMMATCMYGREDYGDSKELEREMLSVDEEYAGMSDQYEVRVVSLLKKICHPLNPWHNCFTCGNSKTLSEKLFPDIRQRCLDFHRNVLKQQDLNLCIVSSHTCAEMRSIAEDCIKNNTKFGQIKPTKQLPLKRIMPKAFVSGKNIPAVLILDAYEWKCEFRFVLPEFRGQHDHLRGGGGGEPQPESESLRISWMSQLLRMQGAMSFISHMFRQQTPGSFLTVLLEKGLTYGVSGCRSYAGIEQNFFDIEFLIDENYTEQGDPEGIAAGDPKTQGVVWLRLMRRIGRALFSYLRLLSSEFSKNPKEFQAYNDFKIIKHFQYQSTNGPDPLTLANEITSKLSSSLRRGVEIDESEVKNATTSGVNSLSQLLIDPPPFDDADDMADAVKELVEKHLVIDNAICILAGPEFSEKQYPTWLIHRGSWLLDKEAIKSDAILRGIDNPDDVPTIIWERDPWFGTKYTICELPDKLGDYFRDCSPTIQQIRSFGSPPAAAVGETAAASPAAIGAAQSDKLIKKYQSTSCASAEVLTTGASGGATAGPGGDASKKNVPGRSMVRHGSVFGQECFEESFSVAQHNRYLPKSDDLKLRRLESVFSPSENSVSIITPSKTLIRVGENILPPTAQLYLHRHSTDVVGTIQCTARFFLDCLQASEPEIGKIHRQGTMSEVGKSLDQSGFLTKMMVNRVILRCLANRLRSVNNEAAVAGINFNVSITNPMSEGQVALELSISGYSGSNTRDLFRYIFDALLRTSEEELGDISRALAEIHNSLNNQAQNCKYDGRSQLNPNLGLILIPVTVPLSSQLKVLETIDKKDILKFIGINSASSRTHARETWNVAKLFAGSTVVCAIGGNVSVDEAVHDWMQYCLLEPLKNRNVELGMKLEPRIGPDGVERLPFHVAILDLDHVAQILPDLSLNKSEIAAYQGDGKSNAGPEFLYAYNSNDVGNIVQININCESEPNKVGLLIVLLKAIEQEFFSWIRDIKNLAYYLSVTFKTVGLDGSVLSFAVCSTTATLDQLLLSSLEIIDAARGQANNESEVANSLSKIWTNGTAYTELRDSVVNMLKDDSDVEGLGNRHRVLIGGLFSGSQDYDSNLEVADYLSKASHKEMLEFSRMILKQRSRLVQLSCDSKTATRLGVQDFQYDQGPHSLKPANKALSDLLAQCSKIDGQRRWLQLRDPRALHRVLFNSPKFERKPRAYRRGTVVVANSAKSTHNPS